MKSSRVFACIVFLAAISGCGPIRPGGGDVLMTANDCSTGSGKCEVYLSVTEPCMTAGNIKADQPTLVLAGKPNRTLVWHLPKDYAFCKGSNDIVMFKTVELDFQFTDPAYTNDAAGGDDPQGGNCKDKFRWKDKNDPHTKNKEYSYYLWFTGPQGRCNFDPFIRNG